MWPRRGSEEVKESNWICWVFFSFFFAVLENPEAFCCKLKQQQKKTQTKQKAAQAVMVGDRLEGSHPFAVAGSYNFSVQTSQPATL